MKVRCIKPYEYKQITVDSFASVPFGEILESYTNGSTETIEDDNGNYIISVDDERFFGYFEFVDEEKQYQGGDVWVECTKAIRNIRIGDIFKSNGRIYDDNDKFVCEIGSKTFKEHFEIESHVEETVNHPEHYQGEIETIDIIEYVLRDINSKHAFALGNVIKYCNMANKKGKQEDLDKAKWYAERLLNG